MTVIANTFYLYQDYNHILSFFWRVGFSQEKRELWNTKMLLSFWKKICVFFSSVLPQDIHIFPLPSKIRACVFKRCRVIWPGTWYSNRGEKDFWMQCKVFLPGTGGTAREAPLPEQHVMPEYMCSDCQRSAQRVQT